MGNSREDLNSHFRRHRNAAGCRRPTQALPRRPLRLLHRRRQDLGQVCGRPRAGPRRVRGDLSLRGPRHPGAPRLQGHHQAHAPHHRRRGGCPRRGRHHTSPRTPAAVTWMSDDLMQLCHRHGVIHRDLNPENLLSANKEENLPLKVFDFGLSIFFMPGR